MKTRSSSRALLFAVILVLPAALAPADDGTALLPLFSGSDGSSVHVEISRTGKRSKAVPVLEIPDDTVRQVSGTGGTGSGLPDHLSAGADGEEGKERATAGFGTRLRSLLVREGPEGVSLGNAFDLAGDIQEAVRKMRNRETPESFANSGNDDAADMPPVSGTGDIAENRGTNDNGDNRSWMH